MDTNRRQLDTFVLEHILKPRFWILGAFIIVFWITTMPRTYADTKTNSKTKSTAASLSRESSTSNPTSTPPQPVFTARVLQFLTTRLQKGLALVKYAIILDAKGFYLRWIKYGSQESENTFFKVNFTRSKHWTAFISSFHSKIFVLVTIMLPFD